MGVEHFSQIMDATELIDNQSAGNIKDAIILYKKKKYKIMINLFGVFLSFHSESWELLAMNANGYEDDRFLFMKKTPLANESANF